MFVELLNIFHMKLLRKILIMEIDQIVGLLVFYFILFYVGNFLLMEFQKENYTFQLKNANINYQII